MAQGCSWTNLVTTTAMPSMNCDILVERSVFWNGDDRLPRSSVWVIASFRDRRLVEAVLRVEMLVVHDGIGGLRTLVNMTICGKLFHVLPRGRMPRVVVMVAVGMGHGVVCVRLIVFQLIGVILSKCRVEVLLLVWPIIKN
jgi:hypothetical protein